METTKLRLAIRLQEVSPELAKRAETGEFSDYESPHATPKVKLINELQLIATTSGIPSRCKKARNIITEVMDGKWDETREEAEAWFQREGKDLLK